MPEARLERTRRNYMQACEFCALPMECDCRCWTCVLARLQIITDPSAFVDRMQEIAEQMK